MTHTSGPWHFLEAHSHDDDYSSSHPLTICSDDNEDLAQIFSSADSTVSITREQAVANAHLIAAAPDLLSALKDLIDDLEVRSKNGVVDCSHGVYCNAKQAISKAEPARQSATTVPQGGKSE